MGLEKKSVIIEIGRMKRERTECCSGFLVAVRGIAFVWFPVYAVESTGGPLN